MYHFLFNKLKVGFFIGMLLCGNNNLQASGNIVGKVSKEKKGFLGKARPMIKPDEDIEKANFVTPPQTPSNQATPTVTPIKDPETVILKDIAIFLERFLKRKNSVERKCFFKS